MKTSKIHDEFLLDSGRIFLWGEITEELAGKFTKELRYVMSKDITSIYVYIHSEGGEVDSACAIVDEINGAKVLGYEIYTIAIGKAYSCAAFILAMGSQECRYATENTSIMLHPVHYELPSDYIDAQRSYTAFSEQQYAAIIDMVAKACGRKSKKTRDSFHSEIKDGLWLDAKQATKKKVIDGIWDYSWEKEIDEEE